MLNVRSLIPSFIALKYVLSQYKCDICCLCETWLTSNTDNSQLYIENYSLVRRDRGARGGGVAMYVKKHLKFKLLNVDGEIEQLWISVKLNGKNCSFGVAYRSPSCNYGFFINELETALSVIVPESDVVVLMGDFNIDLNNSDSLASIAFLNALTAFDLVQVVETATRVTPSTSTLIDLVFISDRELLLQSTVEPVPDISDHDLVVCSLDIRSNEAIPYLRTYRTLKYFDMNTFQEDLYNIPFYFMFDMPSVNDKITFFTDSLVFLLDRHMPQVTTRVSRPPAPWLTDTVRYMQNLRDNALKAFRKSKLVSQWNYYKSLRNLTTESIRREKRAYVEHRLQITSHDVKGTWKFLKNLGVINSKNNIPEHLKDPDNINHYFIDSVPNLPLDIDIFSEYEPARLNNNNFEFQLVDEQIVYETIFSIKSNAAGVDGLTIKFIQLCTPHIVDYLTHVINSCITSGCFPQCWKQSVVTPIPKKSTPAHCGDLRPISILPVLSKIFEKVIERQLREYLLVNDILPQRQSGFRKQYSCNTALLSVVDDIIKAIDKGFHTLLCLLDFSKAFDTINHDLMSVILSYIGLGPTAVNLLYNYLIERSQCVRIDNRTSSYLPIRSGVPQGSILGPLLYTIYTSNFVKYIKKCKHHFYADDTQLYYSFPVQELANACSYINSDINNLNIAARRHCLYLNSAKTDLILFGPKKTRSNLEYRSSVKIVVEGKNISLKNTVKNLGVLLDDNLNFAEHVNECVKRSYAALKMIYTNRGFLSQKIKKLLCESLVLSHMNYCDSLYDPCIMSDSIRKIQKVQNSCLRLIFGIRRRSRISYKLSEIKWLNMKHRRLLHTASLFHSIILTQKPPYLYRSITFRTDVHNVNIRFKGTLTPPIHHSVQFKRCFSYHITFVYNSIPVDIKNVSSLNLFKKKLYQHLFTRQHVGWFP